MKVVKNKVAPPFKQAEMNIIYGMGFCLGSEIVELGVNLGLIDKAGAWFSYQGVKIGQGKANCVKFLSEHTEVRSELESLIRQRLMPSAELSEV